MSLTHIIFLKCKYCRGNWRAKEAGVMHSTKIANLPSHYLQGPCPILYHQSYIAY